MADIPLERELAGLPELEAFPTAGLRETALRSIAAGHEDPYAWEYWLWSARPTLREELARVGAPEPRS